MKEISEEKTRRQMKANLNKRKMEEEISRVYLSSSYAVLLVCIYNYYIYLFQEEFRLQCRKASYQSANQMVEIGLQMQYAVYNKEPLPIDKNEFLIKLSDEDAKDAEDNEFANGGS